MKKRIVSALLCMGVLCGMASAYAAAGDSSDPLISLSYIAEFFKPQVSAALQQTADNAVTEAGSAMENGGSASKTVSVSEGGKVSLGSGQYFVLISGEADIKILSGAVVNATDGCEAASGPVKLSGRYIVCEDSGAELNIIGKAVVFCSGSAAVAQGDGKTSPFTDISRRDWYFGSVVTAHEMGLISGMTTTTYEPGGSLTLAQAIRLSASMHERYYTGMTTLDKSDDSPWYQNFVDYAFARGIIGSEYVGLEPSEYNAPVSRKDFLHIFYNALPSGAYNEINHIEDGAIPDVLMSDEFASEIYKFYRAGIVAGYTMTPGLAERSFGPETGISRAETAAIMIRMFDRDARVSFSIG